MNPERLKVMERWNLAFAALAIMLSALFTEPRMMWGVAAGAVLCCANFYAIRRIWQSVLSGSLERRQAMQALFIVKTMLLIALVFVAVRFLPISPLGFAIGISVFLPSIIVETARFALGGTAVKS